MKTIKRTVVTMLSTMPNHTRFGIYHARVRVGPSRWSWNINTAKHIMTMHLDSTAPWPHYQDLAQPYATAEYPIFEKMSSKAS